MKTAFHYAGQGSQHVGMGQAFYDASPHFREVLDTAPVDFDLAALCLQGPEEQLNETRFTQPCMVAFACGVTDLLREAGVTPDYTAGLSLGEYSALYCAGVLDRDTVIRLAAYRGQVMQEASAGLDCAMIAVIGLDRDTLLQCCEEASPLGTVSIANYNYPGQLVLGGTREAVEAAARFAKERGARRCVSLKVSGPFHTALMAPAGEALAKVFPNVSFQPMQIPVLFNCLGDLKKPEDSIPDLLVRQVQSSVYLVNILQRLQALGVDTVVEIGPGKVLSGFLRKTAPEIRSFVVETPEDLQAAAAAWKGEANV